MFKYLTLILWASLNFISFAKGNNFNWVGATNDLWSVGSNWSGGNTPTSNEGVWMNNSNTQSLISSGQSVTINELIVARHANNVTLTLSGGALATDSKAVFIGQYDDSFGNLILRNQASISSVGEFVVAVAGSGSLSIDGNSSVSCIGRLSVGRYNQASATGPSYHGKWSNHLRRFFNQ